MNLEGSQLQLLSEDPFENMSKKKVKEVAFSAAINDDMPFDDHEYNELDDSKTPLPISETKLNKIQSGKSGYALDYSCK